MFFSVFVPVWSWFSLCFGDLSAFSCRFHDISPQNWHIGFLMAMYEGWSFRKRLDHVCDDLKHIGRCLFMIFALFWWFWCVFVFIQWKYHVFLCCIHFHTWNHDSYVFNANMGNYQWFWCLFDDLSASLCPFYAFLCHVPHMMMSIPPSCWFVHLSRIFMPVNVF